MSACICGKSETGKNENDPGKLSTATTVITTELDVCCKNCRSTRTFLYLLAFVNLVLLIFVIILFINFSKLNRKVENNLCTERSINLGNMSPSNDLLFSLQSNATRNNKTSPNRTSTTVMEKINSTRPPIIVVASNDTTNFLDKLEILEDSDLLLPKKKIEEPPPPVGPDISLRSILLANGTKSNCTCIGPVGPRGPKGDRGRRGRRGFDGKDGQPGKRGERGPPGKSGPVGDVGSMGLPGPPGPPGKNGEDGRQHNVHRPVAHITGIGVGRLVKNLQNSGILTGWENKHGFSIVNAGFSLSNDGRLTVPKFGFYFVYSQVFFQHDIHKINSVLVHYVYLIKANGQTWIILRGYNTKPQHVRHGEGFFTTRASGVFRLQKGDKLAVGVEPDLKTLVSKDESATFFGAYMV